MQTELPTIGIHTHITNSLSSGYHGYLACVESWLSVADEVIVVDGGSTDGSIELLRDWVGERDNLRIVSPPEAYWGMADNWRWPQIAINRQTGFALLDTDWAIHVDADHVAPDLPAQAWREELAQFGDATTLRVPVDFYDNGKIVSRRGPRTWIVNRRQALAYTPPIGYGIARDSGYHLDYPIYLEEWRSFSDPVTGTEKRYAIGRYPAKSGTVRSTLFGVGHFFFTQEQCLAKCVRLDRALNRFLGTFPRTRMEIDLMLRSHRISGRQSKEELLTKPFPPSLLRVIREFYRDDMLGGVLYRPPNRIEERCRELLTYPLRGARRFVRLAARRAQCHISETAKARAH